MPTRSKLPTDKLDEVKFRGQTLRKADVLEVLHALPDATWLSTSEAAIILDYSVSQMERMRVSGTGPRYRQSPPMPGSKGTNLAVHYRKLDLIGWSEKNTETSSIRHAQLHGRTFATLQDISEQVAFYVDESGAVESMVEENTVGTVLDRLGAWEIQWLTAAEACARPWSSLAAHRHFAGVVRNALSHAQGSIAAGLEATELRQVGTEAKPGGLAGSADSI